MLWKSLFVVQWRLNNYQNGGVWHQKIFAKSLPLIIRNIYLLRRECTITCPFVAYPYLLRLKLFAVMRGCAASMKCFVIFTLPLFGGNSNLSITEPR